MSSGGASSSRPDGGAGGPKRRQPEADVEDGVDAVGEPLAKRRFQDEQFSSSAGHLNDADMAALNSTLAELTSSDAAAAAAAAARAVACIETCSMTTLHDVGMLSRLLDAHHAHGSHLGIACSMATMLAAAVGSHLPLTAAEAEAATAGCLSALRRHASHRGIAADAFAALHGLLKGEAASSSAPASWREIVAAGIRTLRLLEDDAAACRTACETLCRLVEVEAAAAGALREGGASDLLLALLGRHADHAALAASCCALLGHVGVATARVSEALAATLQRVGTDGSVVRAGTAAVAQLAQTPAAVEVLVTSGVCEALVSIMQRDESPFPSVAGCCEAVSLVASRGGASRLVTAGAVTAVAGTLSKLQAIASREGSHPMLAALANLAQHAMTTEEQRTALRTSGGGAAAIAFINHCIDEDGSVQQACRLLKHLLAGDATCRAALWDAGAAAAILAAMARYPDSHDVPLSSGGSELINDCCHALRLLAEAPANRDGLMQLSMSTALLAAATVGKRADRLPNLRVQHLCASVQHLLSCERGQQPDAVLQLCDVHVAVFRRAGTTDDIMTACAVVMGPLRSNEAAMKRLASEGAAKALSKALGTFVLEGNHAAIRHACAALFAMCRDASDSALGRLEEAGCGAALVEVVRCPSASEDAKAYAMRTMIRLIRPYDVFDVGAEVAHHACAAASAALLHPAAPRRHAALACTLLAQLSADPGNVPWLQRAGAVELFVLAASCYTEDAHIAGDVCASLSDLADSASAVRTPFADGSACKLLLDCLAQHAGPARHPLGAASSESTGSGKADAHVVASALHSLGILLLMLPDAAKQRPGLDWPAAVQLIGRVALLTEGEVKAGGEERFRWLLGTAACTLFCIERAVPAASAACAAALASLPRDATRQQLHATLLWASLHGSAESLGSAIRLAAGCTGVSWKLCLQMAAVNGRVALVDLLLAQFTDATDASDQAATAARIAASRGNSGLLNHLLTRWRVDPAANGNKLLCLAAANGHHRIAKRLLQEDYPDDDFGDNGAVALRLAAEGGHLKVVERLLSCRSIQRSKRTCEAVRAAAEHGHLAVVTRLLTEERVDPHAGPVTQTALAAAARGGHVGVLEALLEDPRVEPVAFVSAELDAAAPLPLPLSSRYALQSRPAVLRAMMSHADQARVAARFPQSFTAADIRSLWAAAWRRRRAAVLSWLTE